MSSYFQAVKKECVFEGDISQFVRSNEFGAKKLAEFLKCWWYNRFIPETFTVIRYEDIWKDPLAILQIILDTICVYNVPDNILQEAVEFSRFDNMRSLEVSGRFGGPLRRPRDITDEESFKVRRGRIGDYPRYLRSEDITFINEVLRVSGYPFSESYFQDLAQNEKSYERNTADG